MTADEFISIGFKSIDHFTINNALIYDIGRNRHLSLGDAGTPNEMLFLCESDKDDYRKITDLVCLHNFDYDGYISKSYILNLINLLTSSSKTKNHSTYLHTREIQFYSNSNDDRFDYRKKYFFHKWVHGELALIEDEEGSLFEVNRIGNFRFK